MKKSTLFFRRLNRGLVLGIAVVLVLAVWTVISAQIFKRGEKPEIEKMAREYVSELAAFHADFDAQTCSHVLTKAEMDARMKSFSDFTKKYFAYRKSGTMHGVETMNIDEVEASYREYLSEGALGEVLSLTLEPVEVPGGFTIRKTGPNRATVELYFEGTLKTRGVEYCGMWVPGASDEQVWVIDDRAQVDIGGDTSEIIDASKVYESRCAGRLTLHLQKIDGEWKIIFAGEGYFYTHDTRIVEGGADA